jgi:hypothetical protein
MNRRNFLARAAVSGAVALVPRASWTPSFGAETEGERLDGAAVARTLAEHRIAKIEARTVQDRYPRSVGPNGKGNPVGGGGSYQVRIATTDHGATGWAMCAGNDELVRKFIGARLSSLFELSVGTTDELPQEMDRMIFDLVGNIVNRPVYELLGGSVLEALTEVFILQLRILAPQLLAVRVVGHRLQNPPHGQSHVADARLPVHPAWVRRNPVKGHGRILPAQSYPSTPCKGTRRPPGQADERLVQPRWESPDKFATPGGTPRSRPASSRSAAGRAR